MPDDRAADIQRFRETQGATRIHLLTRNTPFSPSQDRFVLAETLHDAFLFACTKCSPRVTIGYGQLHVIRSEVLRAFLGALDAAAAGWNEDAIPAGAHDGATITLEMADSAGYRRVRMVNPAPGTPQAGLLAAWLEAFPQVRRVVR